MEYLSSNTEIFYSLILTSALFLKMWENYVITFNLRLLVLYVYLLYMCIYSGTVENFVIILIPKPNKLSDIPTSYHPLSLLFLFAKLSKKLILKRIPQLININQINPNSQFGFRNSHSTIYQMNSQVDSVSYSLETKKYCSAV